MKTPLTLKVATRAQTGRSASRRLRKVNRIPAILYGKHTDPEKLSIEVPEFTRLLKTVAGRSLLIELARDDKAEKARIKEVIEDGPAAKAGLKAGDVITEFDGKIVAAADDIRNVLRKRRPDDEVEVKLKRGSKTFTMIVTLGKPGE